MTTLNLKIQNQTHGVGFVLRDAVLNSENVSFASFIIKHPQSSTMEAVIHSETLSNNDLKTLCLEKCDFIYSNFNRLFDQVTYDLSRGEKRASKARRAVIEPA